MTEIDYDELAKLRFRRSHRRMIANILKRDIDADARAFFQGIIEEMDRDVWEIAIAGSPAIRSVEKAEKLAAAIVTFGGARPEIVLPVSLVALNGNGGPPPGSS